MPLSILAAVAAAAGYGGGSVVQAMASTKAVGLRVLREPTYAVGTSITLVAWAFSLVALRYLPLLTVQTILSSSLVVTVLLDRFVFGTRLRVVDRWAAIAVTGALAVLALGTGVQSDVAAPVWFGWAMLALLLGLLVATVLTYRRASAPVQALLSGVASAGLAMCARAAHSGTWVDFFLTPTAWLTVGFAVLSSVTFSRAVENGTVGPARALVNVTQVVLPGIVGVWILHDGVRDGWGLACLAAVLVALTSSFVLSTRPAAADGQHPADDTDEDLGDGPSDADADDIAATTPLPAGRSRLA